MSKTTARKPNARGSRELWLDTAYEMLITSGIDSVKVMPLAKQLDMSRGSFYAYFEDRNALLEALIQRWQDKNTANMLKKCRQYAESINEAIFNLFDCWFDVELFDARMDFAIRNWGHQAPDLQAVLKQTDKERIRAIYDMFIRFDYDAEEARVRANTIYMTQIGYISMMMDDTPAERLKHTPGYVQTFTGVPPASNEIERFMSRHQALLPPQ